MRSRTVVTPNFLKRRPAVGCMQTCRYVGEPIANFEKVTVHRSPLRMDILKFHAPARSKSIRDLDKSFDRDVAVPIEESSNLSAILADLFGERTSTQLEIVHTANDLFVDLKDKFLCFVSHPPGQTLYLLSQPALHR